MEESNGSEVLIGRRDIARYCGVCRTTIDNWRIRHGFPVASLPDGRVAITKNLVDQWLMARVGVKTARQRGSYWHRVGKDDRPDQATENQ